MASGFVSRFALLHAEKVLFVAVLGWCSGSALGAVATPPEVVRARDQGPMLDALEAHMRASSVPFADAPRWREALSEQLDPARVPAARPLPPWLLERRPGFLYGVAPRPRPPELGHAPGAISSIEATSRYAVRLGVTPATGRRIIVTQVLERRASDGPWTRVKEVAAGAAEVVDVGLSPRTRYRWRLVSTGALDRDDPEVQVALRAGILAPDLAPGLARVEGPESAEHATPPDLYVLPTSISLDPLHPEQATADVILQRWNPVRGRFDKTTARVQVGDRVGEGILEEVGTATRANPQFGWPQTVQWIRLRQADGTEVVLNDLDIPAELRRK